MRPDQALLLYLRLMGANGHRGRVAVPINTTSQIEGVVGENLEVVRTPASLPELTRVAAEEGVIFAGAAGGGYVFPEFLPAYDAMASLCKLLELLAKYEAQPLSQIAAELPRQTLIHREVAVPVGAEGHGHAGAERAFHRLTTSTCATGSRCFDDRGWFQVLPDPDEPLVHLYAEGSSKEVSRGAGSARSKPS